LLRPFVDYVRQLFALGDISAADPIGLPRVDIKKLRVFGGLWRSGFNLYARNAQQARLIAGIGDQFASRPYREIFKG
jgi:hypothetical protein